MGTPQRYEAVHAEAGALATLEKVHAAPLTVLDGGEIIELSVRPSLWFLPIVAGRSALLLALLAVLLALLAPPRYSLSGTLAVSACVTAAVLRVGWAALQWASRLYVLTNRRVLRFRGVLGVQVSDCPLVQVSGCELRHSPYQRLLRLGTIHIQPLDARRAALNWDHVANPQAVHERLLRAVRRAQCGEG